MQRVKVRHVPMLGLALLEILRPLLQLPTLSSPVGQELFELGLQFMAEVRIAVQQFRGCDAVAEESPHDSEIHGRPHANAGGFLSAVGIRVEKRVLG